MPTNYEIIQERARIEAETVNQHHLAEWMGLKTVCRRCEGWVLILPERVREGHAFPYIGPAVAARCPVRLPSWPPEAPEPAPPCPHAA